MQCRQGCGACCIAPSIAEPFVGMPHGKPAGVRCVHLSADNLCTLFGDARRPGYCASFTADDMFCGTHRSEALQLLSGLEKDTEPHTLAL